MPLLGASGPKETPAHFTCLVTAVCPSHFPLSGHTWSSPHTLNRESGEKCRCRATSQAKIPATHSCCPPPSGNASVASHLWRKSLTVCPSANSCLRVKLQNFSHSLPSVFPLALSLLEFLSHFWNLYASYKPPKNKLVRQTPFTLSLQ